MARQQVDTWEPIGEYHLPTHTDTIAVASDASVLNADGSSTHTIVSGGPPAATWVGAMFAWDSRTTPPLRLQISSVDIPGGTITVPANFPNPGDGIGTVTIIQQTVDPYPEFRKCGICGRWWPVGKLRRNRLLDDKIVCPQDYYQPGPSDRLNRDAAEMAVREVRDEETSSWVSYIERLD